MNYQRVYDDLIHRGRVRIKPEGYTERHHIHPKCLGGNDHPNNLVVLTAREHYIAHALLAKLYGGGLWRAFYLMSNISGKVNSKLYARSKSITVTSLSGWKHSDESKAKMSLVHKGKSLSEEHKSKLSLIHKTIGISPEHRLKLAGWKHSEEARNLISERGKGREVGEHARKIASLTHKGKTISEETRKRISEGNKGKVISEETKLKISLAHLNRFKTV